MPRPRKSASTAAPGGKRPIAQYTHEKESRVNNPPVGLVDAASDSNAAKSKTYAYDPHLDPQLQWAGKTERTSFEVPTVSLHVHERIDPRSILEAVRKKNGSNYEQLSLWNDAAQNPPLRDAIEFYQHRHGWTNRLTAGDSLLVMNSLLEKEGMAGKVQMLYCDPPYGIRYGSNFQPFVNKRDVKDGKDEDLTSEPEMIKAFRDTWELGLHSYLSYLRDRLLLARELLTESGSAFVQISDENVHHVREIMDEVFGAGNFVSQISFTKTGSLASGKLASVCDYLILYAKDAAKQKFRQIYESKDDVGIASSYSWIDQPDGTRRALSSAEKRERSLLEAGTRFYQPTSLVSTGATDSGSFVYKFGNKDFRPPPNSHWKTTKAGLDRLVAANRIVATTNSLRYVRYLNDFEYAPIVNTWTGFGLGSFTDDQVFVVQTSPRALTRCLLMTTDPGDLVLDITCGSGTTAMVAEQWGRRWMTCDTSRVALTLAKQRLMTSVFDYYQLAHPAEGVGSGFLYKKVPHVTLKSIANNEPPAEETLYDQPLTDSKKVRVCGPFTVEAVPAPVVNPVAAVCDRRTSDVDHADDAHRAPLQADNSVARQGETLRQEEWRSELLRTGIRGKNGQYLMFSRVEPLPGTRWLHAEGETRPDDRGGARVREQSPAEAKGHKRVVISFGPAHAPLEQRQVEQALEEASHLVPKPSLVVFAAFQFDPEAAKDIDETRWPGVTLVKAHMNADMLTDDLKKKRASNESFWMVGQPDVHLRQIMKGDDSGLWECEVLGFDYFNPKTGEIESGGPDRIAVWMLDTDYDGRSLFPRQVFFPMAGEKEGWARLAKNLKAEIDEVMIEAYRGTLSVPFELGKHRRVAVKIVDDRGIESLKIMYVVKREE
ncbi:MAG: site-specific DNA-methyltransferase [Verrucomicrobia bacterium]|nr:site-specific DNA-methyltransferase [Verrucomicrobiota bacterium]